LQVYLKNSRAAVCGKVLEHGDAIRGEFANRIGQLLDLTNDALNAGIDNRDHKMLQLLSQQVLAVYNLSCLVEDTVVGWHLKTDIRRLLRIAANRLTEGAGIPTILPVRAVTNPPPSHRNRKE